MKKDAKIRSLRSFTLSGIASIAWITDGGYVAVTFMLPNTSVNAGTGTAGGSVISSCSTKVPSSWSRLEDVRDDMFGSVEGYVTVGQ